MTTPTDTQLFEEAIACGLVSHIRLAAACHPEKIGLEEVCSPANAALIVFARRVLERWGADAAIDEVLERYETLANQTTGCFFHQ